MWRGTPLPPEQTADATLPHSALLPTITSPLPYQRAAFGWPGGRESRPYCLRARGPVVTLSPPPRHSMHREIPLALALTCQSGGCHCRWTWAPVGGHEGVWECVGMCGRRARRGGAFRKISKLALAGKGLCTHDTSHCTIGPGNPYPGSTHPDDAAVDLVRLAHLVDCVGASIAAIAAHHKQHVNAPHVDALDNLPAWDGRGGRGRVGFRPPRQRHKPNVVQHRDGVAGPTLQQGATPASFKPHPGWCPHTSPHKCALT